jgi:hypothetical protein
VTEAIGLYDDEADDEYERLCKAADLAADLLVVSARHREEFVENIYILVSTVNIRIKLVENRDARFLAAAKAVRAAHGALAKLPPQQRRLLRMSLTDEGRFHWRRFPWLPVFLSFKVGDSLVLDLIDVMDDAFGDLIGRSPHAPSGKRGKPGGAKAQWVMHNFVGNLWLAGNRFGGDVTLSNLGGQAKGSIVEMLVILKPMLPKQFFPGILSYSFLRKVQKSLPELKRRLSVYSE